MTSTAIRGSSTTGLLDGTLPLRPFHPDGFVGTLSADGQQVRVAALASDETRVVALSLVGYWWRSQKSEGRCTTGGNFARIERVREY